VRSVVVTGGAGYIGSVLCGSLLDEGYRVTCLDRCFFGDEPVAALTSRDGFTLIKDDIRFCGPELFDSVDVVMDLAGISNDPSADLEPEITEQINTVGALRLAELARERGVRRFLYASSCAIYGASRETELSESAEPNPVSLYAQSKWRFEQALLGMAGPDFCVTFLRNATAFGLSPRMRFDLMINIMTAHAVTQRKIFVLGGGKQWRPTVHVKDIARAFLLADRAPAETINGEVFNVGCNEQNFRVLQVANLVARMVPNTEIEVVPADPDRRDYHVRFDKIADVLGFETRHGVDEGIEEVRDAVLAGTCSLDDLRTSTVRYYQYLIEADRALQAVKLNGRLF
jgi:nucleoside-diphosphate-sugar epimerase